jgi:hypothetical protein
MPQPCKICRHTDRQAIDTALLKGWPALRVVGQQFGVSKDALHRHRAAHLNDGEPRQIARIAAQKEPDEPRQMAELAEQKKEPGAAPAAIGSPEWWAALEELFGRMKTDAGGA